MNDLEFKLLSIKNIASITDLGKELNPKLSVKEIKDSFTEMFTFDNYRCFGLLKEDLIIGISSGWITHKLYSGRQLEVDNVIITSTIQSKGYGKTFFQKIEEWASINDCNTIELNSYITNSRSHKFYFNLEYTIIGYHFYKEFNKV